MIDHSMDTLCTNNGKPSTAPGSVPLVTLEPVVGVSPTL